MVKEVSNKIKGVDNDVKKEILKSVKIKGEKCCFGRDYPPAPPPPPPPPPPQPTQPPPTNLKNPGIKTQMKYIRITRS